MKVRRGRKAVSVLFVASLSTGGLVLLSESVTPTKPPQALFAPLVDLV
jgi:hypothetical protein